MSYPLIRETGGRLSDKITEHIRYIRDNTFYFLVAQQSTIHQTAHAKTIL